MGIKRKIAIITLVWISGWCGAVSSNSAGTFKASFGIKNQKIQSFSSLTKSELVSLPAGTQAFPIKVPINFLSVLNLDCWSLIKHNQNQINNSSETAPFESSILFWILTLIGYGLAIGLAIKIYRTSQKDKEINHSPEETVTKENQVLKNALNEMKKLHQRFVSHYRALDTSAIVSTTDPDGKITYVNKNFELLFGYTEKELLGKSHAILNSGEHDASFWKTMWETISSGKTWRAVIKNRTKNGSFRWVDMVISPVQDENGQTKEILSISFDITEQKTAEKTIAEHQQQLNRLIRTNPGIVFRCLLDENWTMLFISKGIERLTGYSPDDFINNRERSYRSLIHPDDMADIERTIEIAIETRQAFSIEYRILNRNGQIVWVYEKGQAEYSDQYVPTHLDGTLIDLSDRKLIEMQLDRSRTYLRQIIESTQVGIAIFDFQTIKPLLVNRALCQELEIDYEVSLEFETIDTFKDKTSLFELIEEMKEKGRILNREMVFVRQKSGEEFWAVLSMLPLEYDSKKAVLVSFMDITDRKKREEFLSASKKAADAIVDTIPIPAVVSRLDNGKVLRGNHALAEFHGVEQSDLETMQTSDWYVNSQDRENFITRLNQYGKLTNEPLLIRKSRTGEIRNALVSIIPINYMDQNCIIGSMIDVTDMKQIQAELSMAKDEAELATEAKSRFLASMSHEIRTPMNAILGLASLALKTDLNLKQKDYLNKIHFSAKSLLVIINDILDFSKIEAGKLTLENTNFNLEELLSSVTDLVAQKAQEKGLEYIIRIEKNVPLWLVGDPLRISQIISNFCNNAVKFTERGEIVLRVKHPLTMDNEAILEFSVKDTGIGLTKLQKTRLFHSFTQADQSTTRKYGGTGLGLVISKRLSQLMNGEVWVESEYDTGSTFYFALKLQLQQNHHNKELKPPSEMRNLRVLVCDDNATVREVLGVYLERLSFRVDTVDSGQEAINAIKKSGSDPYRLLLLDLKMPGYTGMETARIIREETYSDSPVIIMGPGFRISEIEDQFKDSGIGAFLTKPVIPSDLFDTIMNVFGKEIRSQKSTEFETDKEKMDMAAIKGAHILVVEDNDINQQIAGELLQSAGVKVEIAPNGKEALDLLTKSGTSSEFDLVLMDIQMPIMDGYEATREIRRLSHFDGLPIIAMTADAMVGVKGKCLALGMQDYLPKPIQEQELFDVLHKWLNPENSKSLQEHRPIAPSHKNQEQGRLPEIEGIDVQAGLKLIGNNLELYREILAKFAKSKEHFEDELNDLIKRNERETATREIHSLKGISGNIGAENLYKQALDLEQLLRTSYDDKARIEDLSKSLLKELKMVISNIREALKEEKSAGFDIPKHKASREEILEILDILIENLEQYSTNATDDFYQLKEVLEPKEFQNELLQIESYIESFDFEKALKVCLSLREKV